jgi:hypothetical protein
LDVDANDLIVAQYEKFRLTLVEEEEEVERTY